MCISRSSSATRPSANIKPGCELRWQIRDSGYVYGTYEETGAGGWPTEHHVVIRRISADQQVPIRDYAGDVIGLQHNVTLKLLAVNKGGAKPYTGTAGLYIALGSVPSDYVQGKLPIQDIGYAKFPAANMRWPNHFEYYVDNPFPVLLYEAKDLPDLVLGSAGFAQMQTAYQCGIINGVSASSFSPNALITRQDASAMLIRAFSLYNSGLLPADAAGAVERFSDRASVSAYAVDSLEKSVSLGFFGGYPDGTFLPKNNITNEQTAKILWELKLAAQKPGLQWQPAV